MEYDIQNLAEWAVENNMFEVENDRNFFAFILCNRGWPMIEEIILSEFTSLESHRVHFRPLLDPENSQVRIKMYFQEWHYYESRSVNHRGWGLEEELYTNEQVISDQEAHNLLGNAKLVIVYVDNSASSASEIIDQPPPDEDTPYEDPPTSGDLDPSPNTHNGFAQPLNDHPSSSVGGHTPNPYGSTNGWLHSRIDEDPMSTACGISFGGTFYQYIVSITTEDAQAVEGKGIGRKILDKLYQTNCSELAMKCFAYDGEKTLFTVDPIPQNHLKLTVLLEESSVKRSGSSPSNGSPSETENSKHSDQSKALKIEISSAAEIPSKSIALALKGNEAKSTGDALRVLDIMLRQQAARRVSIPHELKKEIQNIKDIVGNYPDDEIYVMLKKCSMDLDQTILKLMSQGVLSTH